MSLSRCFVALAFTCAAAFAQNLNYTQHNLVSDVSGNADNTDPNIAGIWGICESPTSPWWVSNRTSGTATIYNGTTGAVSTTVVQIPPGASSSITHGQPTGQVNNGTTGFLLHNGNKASFIFSTLDGTISAWNGGGVAEVKVDNSGIGASYTGLAIGIDGSKGPLLYVPDIKYGHIDVFDTNFNEVATGGSFTDPTLPAGLAPFNIQRFGRYMIVTYATSNAPSYTQGAGTGAVSLFDLDGNFIRRIATGAPLNAPWGVAVSPNQFGTLSYTVLIGNFGDGKINAFDVFSGKLVGTMMNSATGNAVSIPGLWGLQFGSGTTNGGAAESLYFAADGGGLHGVFGTLVPASDSVQP